MAKAAIRLNISQPAVSKAIAELEHVFGVRLVVRNRQGIEPTSMVAHYSTAALPYSMTFGWA
jgi:DNA-binding transcriptional LysR family regulator